MISLTKAFQLIDETIPPLSPGKIAPLEAVGCRLVEDIRAQSNVPDFASSAMDGIAIAYKDVENRCPIELKLQGIIPAGLPALQALKPGHAYRIMTGAALPDGADTVIPVEELQFSNQSVLISHPPKSGSHVRPAGNDLRSGDLVFPEGYRFTTVDAGICAVMGLTEVKVYPKPKIALFATGSEIVAPGQPLQPGQIYNSNDITLQSLLRSFGSQHYTLVSAMKDDPDQIGAILGKLSRGNDLIITSGAVSMGNFDYIPKVVEKMGGEILFHKVFVKPGKPALIAKVNSCWLLALPGNPVSVLVTFHLYGKRLIARLMGLDYQPAREKATLTDPCPLRGDRFQVIGAVLERRETGLFARPSSNYSSGRLSSIKGMNGFVLLEGGTRTVPAGEIVDVEWL